MMQEACVKACDGVPALPENGDVIYKTCFSAGTLVRTDRGKVDVTTLNANLVAEPKPEWSPLFRSKRSPDEALRRNPGFNLRLST